VAETIAVVEAPEPELGWERRVEALLATYRQIDLASLRLPALGSTEWPASSWREFVKRQSEAPSELTQTWRGEVFLPGGMVSRPLVSSLLAAHFRRRLALLRRWLVLQNSTDKEDVALLASVDAALETWRARRTIAGGVTFVITILGTVGGLVSVANGVREMPVWGWLLVAAAILCAYLFVVGSFVAKRGLMLGESGGAAYAPSAVAGSGAYGLERDVFGAVRINRSEIPLDIVLADLFVALPAGLGFAAGVWWLGALFTAWFLLNAVAYWRRRRLRRL